MQEKENILRILEGTIKALKDQDVVKLKELSDQTIHTASISQDPDNIAVAVIVYSLSKIVERKNYKGWDVFYKKIVLNIQGLIDAIKKGDEKRIDKKVESIRRDVTSMSGSLKKNISDVFRKASINKASKIYEHGISLEKTAKLLGITMFDLASYAGQKDIGEVSDKGVSVKERVKLIERIFG
ncbi:hypothetical protein ACFL0X_00335 [Nanoarchaeota archaeon]